MLKRTLTVIVVVFALLAAGFLGFVYHIGAWNILFPSSHHETTPPSMPQMDARPSILLFTKTNSFRHKAAIRAGSNLFQALSSQNDWNIFATENSAVFNPEDLGKFDVIIFHNVTGNAFSADQQSAFEGWLLAGGGWLGTHAAGDGSHFNWPWYMKNLIGVRFTAHTMGPQFQDANMINEDREHRVMSGLPEYWTHNEEWYSWGESARNNGFTVLASVDEATYRPEQNLFGRKTDLRMGDHPVIWRNCVGNGRSVYSALGHAAAAYEDANHIRLLENALYWLLEAKQGNCH